MRSSTWLMRLIRAAAFATAMAGTFAGGVSAKIPNFSVEITPMAPIAGEPVLVVVQFWVDADHTHPGLFDARPMLDGLLVIRAADTGEPEIPVPLRMRAPGRFEASVILQPGEWNVVAFPDRTGWPTAAVPVGYPDTIQFTVGERVADAPGFAVPLVAVALVVVAGAFRLRHGSRGLGLWPDRDTQVT